MRRSLALVAQRSDGVEGVAVIEEHRPEVRLLDMPCA
jgi:hypothetical protein